jgi:hypothetical protein
MQPRILEFEASGIPTSLSIQSRMLPWILGFDASGI